MPGPDERTPEPGPPGPRPDDGAGTPPGAERGAAAAESPEGGAPPRRQAAEPGAAEPPGPGRGSGQGTAAAGATGSTGPAARASAGTGNVAAPRLDAKGAGPGGPPEGGPPWPGARDAAAPGGPSESGAPRPVERDAAAPLRTPGSRGRNAGRAQAAAPAQPPRSGPRPPQGQGTPASGEPLGADGLGADATPATGRARAGAEEAAAPGRPLRAGGGGDGLARALLGLIGGEDGAASAEDVADALWMARFAGVPGAAGPDEVAVDRATPSGGREADGPAPGPRVAPERPGGPPPRREPPADEQPAAAPAEPRVGLHPLGAAGGGPSGAGAGGAASHVVQVSQPPALAGALDLARALRPLRQSVAAPGAPLLDEEATAQATAEAGRLIPVWRPASERRFSVDLLVDTGATMAVWHRLAAELCTVLERHGAFGDVRCWALDTGGPVPRLAPFRRSGATAGRPSGTTRWSGPLEDPTGRAVLLVLTDGVGPAWYAPQLPDFLARVAGERPAAALQVLPRRLWHRTALRTAPVELRVPDPARPVAEVRTDAPLPGLPRGERPATGVGWLPVMEVDGAWLAPWAGLVAGRVPGWSAMLAAPLRGVPRPRRAAGPSAPRDPAGRVARFRSGCSPDAFRLACHLAAAPLSLPVMRLVQQATMPWSGQTDLAELFLSGLLERRGAPGPDPDEVVYDFVPGVRAELLAELTRTESLHVLEDVLTKVSGRVAATFGGTLDFRALAALVDGTAALPDGVDDGRLLPEASLPFAEVAVAVLSGAGGQHRALARRLAAAAEGRVLLDGPDGGEPGDDGPDEEAPGDDGPGDDGREAAAREEAAPQAAAPALPHPEYLTPVPPITSPPDPARMIGRKSELIRLERALRPRERSPAAAVVEGLPDSGRRRLVQEYVRRYGDRHSFVHWIDGRTADSLRAGLSALLSALGPDEATPSPSVWDLLAPHRDWLVVIDGVRSAVWAQVADLLPRYGRGSVVVTVGLLEERSRTPGTVITLGDLTRAEIMSHVSASVEPDLLALLRRRPSVMGRLADRLPTHPAALAAVDVRAELVRELRQADTTWPTPLYEWRGAEAGSGLAGFVLERRVWLATAGYGGPVLLWDSAGETAAGRPLPGGPTAVRALTVFPGADGRPMAAVAAASGFRSSDRPVTIWDLQSKTGQESLVARGTARLERITSFTSYGGGTRLATTVNGSLEFWHPVGGGAVVTPPAATDVRALTFFDRPDGRPLVLIVNGRTRTVHVRDTVDGAPVDSPLPSRLADAETLTTVRDPGRTDVIAAIGLGRGSTVHLWDSATGATLGRLDTHTAGRLVAVDGFNGPDGRPLLATSSTEGITQVWDLSDLLYALRSAPDPAALATAAAPAADLDPAFSLWLLDFLDAGDGVPQDAVTALRRALGEGGRYRLLGVEEWDPDHIAEISPSRLQLTSTGRAVLGRLMDEERSVLFPGTLYDLMNARPEPTADPATWHSYEEPGAAYLASRVLNRVAAFLPDFVSVRAELGLALNWSRYHLLRGDPAEADRLATLADSWPTGADSAAAGAARRQLKLASLAARSAGGDVWGALSRCDQLAAPGRVMSSDVAAEALLHRAELRLWQGRFPDAETALRTAARATRSGMTATTSRHRALHHLLHGELSTAQAELRAGENLTASGRETHFSRSVEEETADLLTSGHRAYLDGWLHLVVDDVATGPAANAVPVLTAGLRLLRTPPAGVEAGWTHWGYLRSRVPSEYFDLWLAFAELLVAAHVRRATGPLWGARGREASAGRHPSVPEARRLVSELRTFRGPVRETRPHLYARFQTAEGHVLLADGEFGDAALALADAHRLTTEVYGRTSPLLPRLGLLLARAYALDGRTRQAEQSVSAVERLLDDLYGDRPHQDRVTALRARSQLAVTAEARARAARRAEDMAAELLRDVGAAPGG